jgi:hypothetical protein
MLEMSTSGLMSGEGKRAGAFALRTAPFLDSTPCPRSKMRQGLQWRGVRGIQQSEMHASGLSTGSAKFRILSGDPAFRFELVPRYRAPGARRSRAARPTIRSSRKPARAFKIDSHRDSDPDGLSAAAFFGIANTGQRKAPMRRVSVMRNGGLQNFGGRLRSTAWH